MDDNEVKDIMFKEVDLIQGVINRMASNSFMIKGWSLTVAGIAYSLNLSFGKVWILGVGITLLCFLFWFLDTFFLRTERKYRALYNDVVSKYNKKKYKEIKWFNLNTKDYEFDPSVGSFKKVMFSKTLLPFYLCLILISVLITLGTIFIGVGSTSGGNQ